jgi:DNA repair photolyase
VPFDRSVNAYRGCEHGCIYCYARPTHAYLDLSPGLDFESRFSSSQRRRDCCAAIGRTRIHARAHRHGHQHRSLSAHRGRYRLTRQVLELCLETRHPVTITTKSDRVLPISTYYRELARHHLTAVAISVTSLDARLSRLLEPRAASPSSGWTP